MINTINRKWHKWRVDCLTRELGLQTQKVKFTELQAADKNSILDDYDLREVKFKELELASVLKYHQDQLARCS